MSSLQIKITPPLERVGKAIALIKLGAALQRGIEKFAFGIERYAKTETPVDTGRLRSSISTDIGTLRARVQPHVVYAGWIHEGKMSRGGKVIRIRGLGRAGTPPGGKPFMALGVQKAKQKFGDEPIVKELTAEVKKSVAKLK